jgi:hypothetical protein
MAIKGNVNDYSIPRIMIDLYKGKKTGILLVTAPSFTKRVFLDKGNAVFASSTHEDERLGEMMVKAGKITLEQYNRSVEILRETGKRQGAILVEQGYMAPPDIAWGVKYQVKEIIYSLFKLEDAEYAFEEGDAPSGEMITLRMSMGNLIYEGIKRISSITRIMGEVEGMDSVVGLNENPVSLFNHILITHKDKTLLSKVNGERTIRQLVDETSSGSFENLKSMFFFLVSGIVEAKEEGAEKADEAFVAQRLEELYSEDPEMTEITLGLEDVDLYISQGLYGDAMEVFEGLLSDGSANASMLQRFEELKSLMKIVEDRNGH